MFRLGIRESFQYLYARPWQKVVDFYADLVSSGNGASSLRSLFPSEVRVILGVVYFKVLLEYVGA